MAIRLNLWAPESIYPEQRVRSVVGRDPWLVPRTGLLVQDAFG